MWSRRLPKSIGLVSSASAPPSKAFRLVSASPYAIIMMTGTSGRAARALGNSSRPLIPGMLMSEKMRISRTSDDKELGSRVSDARLSLGSELCAVFVGVCHVDLIDQIDRGL